MIMEGKAMTNQRILLSETTGAYMDTYLLAASDQIQIGATRPVVLVCPGGAYLRTSDSEAEQVALHFNTLGFHAAVVRYSCGNKALWPTPMVELASAIKVFRENARQWYVRPDRIAVCGFSAGGHLCAMISNKYAEAAQALGVSAELVKPDAAILGYPAIDMRIDFPYSDIAPYLEGEVDPEHPERSVTPLYQCGLCEVNGKYMIDFKRPMLRAVFGTTQPSREQLDALSANLLVTEDTCPSFVWNTCDDELVLAINSIEYVEALQAHHVPCEYHMFISGPHGLSLADETVAVNDGFINPEVARWFGLCRAWLRKIDFVVKR